MAEQAWRPRPCVTHTGGPGRPGFPSALTTKGRLRKKAAAVRMKGGESRPDHGDESLRFGPDETVPGWKTPQVDRREAACPQGTRHRKVQTKKVRLSALRSLTLVRGRKMTAAPTPTKSWG